MFVIYLLHGGALLVLQFAVLSWWRLWLVQAFRAGVRLVCALTLARLFVRYRFPSFPTTLHTSTTGTAARSREESSHHNDDDDGDYSQLGQHHNSSLRQRQQPPTAREPMDSALFHL